MKKDIRKIPVWLAIVIDFLIIAAYVGGFYQIYYRTPRKLESVASATTVAKAADNNNPITDQEDEMVADTGETGGLTTETSTGIERDAESTNSESITRSTDTESGARSIGSESTASDTGTESNIESTSTASNTGAENSTGGVNKKSNTDTAENNTKNIKREENASSESNTGKDSGMDSTTNNLKAKFSKHFTDTVILTESSYSSKDISITVDQYTSGSGRNKVTYYIADIYLADITSLQSGFAQNTYGVGYTDTVLDMDEKLGAILAINGDYYGNGEEGVVIRNGEVYRATSNGSDVCVLYMDGTMKTYSAEEFDAEQAINDGAWQAWCFGPELLDDEGNSMTQFTTDNHIRQTNPRSAIGYYEPGHYCLIVVDGRQSGYSEGMTLTDLSSLFKELGCTAAYNLDGGKSSSMTFNDTEVNQACDGGREVSDCVIIKEVN